MPDILNSFQRANIAASFEKLHDTFSRTITVYQNAEATIISDSPSYNPIYSPPSNNIEYALQKKEFKARIYYSSSEDSMLEHQGGSTTGPINKIVVPQGIVKIVVNKEGFDYLREARIVEFDYKTFAIKSNGSPINMFSDQFFEFILTPIDE